ncbi:MAG: hypothetical protein UHO11_09560 [Treponema sp.]|nr:hypothetical protein [Treponema sp.]
MKCNIFLTVASVLIAALIGYGFYAANSTEHLVWLLCSGAGITSALTLTGIFGISTKGRTGGINITALSSIFFVVFLISNLVFTFTKMKLAPYVIINGILLLIYAVSTYGIIKSRQ